MALRHWILASPATLIALSTAQNYQNLPSSDSVASLSVATSNGAWYSGSFIDENDEESFITDPSTNLSLTVQQAASFGGASQAGNNGNFYLTSTGCLLSNTGNNCTTFCTRPELIFNDTATLANCMVYRSVSAILATGNASKEFSGTAMKYGISASNEIATNISSMLQSCFTAYCQSSKSCTASNETNYHRVDRNDDDATLVYEGESICEGVIAPVQADIAGIGIYTSYLLQIGIALSAFTLLKLYDFWLYYIVIAVRIWRSGLARARYAAQRVRKKARERPLVRLAAALVEFQKAQCYFMLAVQIAAMVTLSEGQFQPTNLQQLYNNWAAVHVVAVSGFLPVTFTLLCLRSVGKRSWYLTALTTVTVAVSTTTLFMTGDFSPSASDVAFLGQNQQAGTISLCGNHDPTLYCLERYMDDSAFGGGGIPPSQILIYSILILSYSITDLCNIPWRALYLRCKSWLEQSTALQTVASLGNKYASTIEPLFKRYNLVVNVRKTHTKYRVPRLVLLVRNALAACFLQLRQRWRIILEYVVYAIIWAIYFNYFLFLISSYSEFRSYGIINDSWNFGQIVGITVWAEPLVEYAYLEIKGMGAASYRYLPPWAVANIGQKDETSEKFEEEDLKLAEPLTRQGYTGPGQIPDTEYRSSRSENQQAEYSHHGDEQLADTMAQRLL